MKAAGSAARLLDDFALRLRYLFLAELHLGVKEVRRVALYGERYRFVRLTVGDHIKRSRKAREFTVEYHKDAAVDDMKALQSSTKIYHQVI